MAHCGAHHKLCVKIYYIYNLLCGFVSLNMCSLSPPTSLHLTSCCLLYDPIGHVCLAFADFIIIIIILCVAFCGVLCLFFIFCFALARLLAHKACCLFRSGTCRWRKKSIAYFRAQQQQQQQWRLQLRVCLCVCVLQSAPRNAQRLRLME